MLSTVLPLKITQRLFYHFCRKKIDSSQIPYFRNIFIVRSDASSFGMFFGQSSCFILFCFRVRHI
ncbi:hypothetical protein FZC77_21180 [Bacillus swezeyi]|uniref:Uncharacterized protein n=1 Tax=Bacillus swezeyi TaxID=1925020 RepID=A0A5M8RIG8_9BACI|nr:hypothetical protein DX927_21890 [Bacillus swezeyi]KAA6472902.1 hypothetical protein DX928_21175 [Bacillus swezeyi]TYS32750.1 hypothetical protein FZC77_21180 [Bacillus swezeyi]